MRRRYRFTLHPGDEFEGTATEAACKIAFDLDWRFRTITGKGQVNCYYRRPNGDWVFYYSFFDLCNDYSNMLKASAALLPILASAAGIEYEAVKVGLD